MTMKLINNLMTQENELYAVDWLKVVVEVNHNRDSINDGLIAYCAKEDYDNPILSYKPMFFASYETSLKVKSLSDNKLTIENNFFKWLNGQNILGKTNINELVHDVVVKLAQHSDINPTEEQLNAIKLGNFKIQQIDINKAILFDNKQQAANYLERIKLNGSYPKRKRYIKNNTVYFGIASERKVIKFYHKGTEVEANKQYQPAITSELKAIADKMVRFEIKYKPIELNEMDLQYGNNWNDETILRLVDRELERLNLPMPISKDDLPKRYLKFISCYKSGSLIDCYTISTIRKMKRELAKLYGIHLDNLEMVS